MNKIFDVIIVGGGPGGAHLANLLARENYDVLLLEKDPDDRAKCCAGAVSIRGVKLLGELPMVEAELNHLKISYQGELETIYHAPTPIAKMVMRHAFDAWLRQKARECGAQVLTNTRVVRAEIGDKQVKVGTIGANREAATYTGRILVGADGANSIVAQRANLKPRFPIGIAVESEIPLPPAALAAWQETGYIEYGTIPGGYAWIFPKKNHLSVGLGTFSKQKVALRPYLQRFWAVQGLVEAPVTGHPIPYGGKTHRIQRERVLLLGDAAFLADPLTGEGIYQALLSATFAAEAIATACKRQNFVFTQYQERIDRELQAELRIARYLAKFFYRFPHFSHRLLVRHPGAYALYFQTTRGCATYAELLTTLRKKFLPF